MDNHLQRKHLSQEVRVGSISPRRRVGNTLLSVFHWHESWSWVWRKGLATTWDTSSHPLSSFLVPNACEQMWGRAFGGTPGSRWWSEMTSVHFLV